MPRVAVHIWPDKHGQLTGTLDSLNQEADGLRLCSISFKQPALHFTVPSVEGAYQAKLDDQESAILVTWMQHGASLPLVLERVSQ